MRILLVNPPARRAVLRDYLCSKTTKSDYVYQPIDLLMLSGTLAGRHAVQALDCVAEGLGPAEALARVRRARPQLVVGLVAAVTWSQDRAFYARVAAEGVRVVATGDVLHEDAAARLEGEPWLEAALHDFTSDELLHYLEGDGRADYETLTTRFGGRVRPASAPADPRRRGAVRVPRPRHELFPRRGYRFPFARRTPFATVLTDHGCPHPCTFCVMSTLGHRERPLADVLEELDELRARGTTELFLLDQTFALRRSRGLELCAALERRGDLSWTAFLRPDNADGELLAAMRRAGCHTVILGAESPRDAVLARYRKGYRADAVRLAFRRARAAGLRTVGTLLVGLPEDDAASLDEQLAYALELELDFLSVNVAVPRFGTPFRRRVLALGLASADELEMDQAADATALPTATLGRGEVLRLKRRLVRRFYLRPGYLLSRLARAQGPGELIAHARSGLALLVRNARLRRSRVDA